MKRIILVIISCFIFIFTLVGCDNKPEITQDAINTSIQEMKKYPEVADATVQVKDDAIYLAIVVKDTSLKVEKAKDLADSFSRILSSSVSAGNKDVSMPNKESLGGIYDSYDLNIAIGTDASNIMYQGAKVSGAQNITWSK